MTRPVRPRVLRSDAIRDALGLSARAGHEPREYRGASTDSRTIEPGQLFVALEGERHDAADFLPQAAARGAPGAIVREGRENAALALEYFAVPDPLAAFGRLAARVRRGAQARVAAVTGSSGKTTVKEMIALALGPERRVYRTEGNLNSQVGLPLTILGAPDEAEVWVLEVGASEPGEIARLAEIARPDDAVVTTVGPAHLEAFGTVERVLEEKLDLARAASETGVVVVGERPPALARAARAFRPDTVVAGLGDAATYRPERWEVSADRVRFERGGVAVEVPVGGEHHLRDALIAAAVADALGVPLAAAARGLGRYAALGLRGEVRQIGGLTVLADCYNANPESFAAAIAQCRDLYPGRRLAAFVGSMLELGAGEADAHREVARQLVDAGFALVAATGAFAGATADGAGNGTRVLSAVDPDAVWDAFAAGLEGGEVVLVKASRGARLERVLERLERRFGAEGG